MVQTVLSPYTRIRMNSIFSHYLPPRPRPYSATGGRHDFFDLWHLCFSHFFHAALGPKFILSILRIIVKWICLQTHHRPHGVARQIGGDAAAPARPVAGEHATHTARATGFRAVHIGLIYIQNMHFKNSKILILKYSNRRTSYTYASTSSYHHTGRSDYESPILARLPLRHHRFD